MDTIAAGPGRLFGVCSTTESAQVDGETEAGGGRDNYLQG